MSTTDTACTCATDRDAHRCPIHSQADYDAQQDPAPDAERDERLRGIQERAAAATEGPWVETYPQSRTIISEPDDQVVVDAFNDGVGAGVADRADALFIAAARTDVPWLLAEITRLAAVVTAVRALRDEYFDEDGHTEPEDVWRLHRDLGRALDGGAR